MFSTSIEPDFQRMVDVVKNKKADILPLYEHNVCYEIIGELTNTQLASIMQEKKLDEGFKIYNNFFRQTGYDVVTFEQCITAVTIEGGALMGGKAGPIQNAETLRNYPWQKTQDLYWDMAAPQFEALGRNMPKNMKAIGGVGNGVFEISEDLTGLEYLPFLQMDDADAYADLYKRIGDLMIAIWEKFLKEFGDIYCVCRFGDDLGFRTSLLTMPSTVREHIIPQYKRVIDLIHSYNKPFLYHSCGAIFEVMDDVIDAGIDAKHSNEDAIAPFDYWIEKYSNRIGLLGGIDMDYIVRSTPEKIKDVVLEKANKYYNLANGYAIGTGNSIPDYVPAKNYLAMLEAVDIVRNKRNSQVF